MISCFKVNMMNIGIAYNGPVKQVWLNIDVNDSCTVMDALTQSGILVNFPEIDIETAKIGIYGKFVKTDAVLKDGDRVEIYRPITADPKTVHRRDVDDD